MLAQPGGNLQLALTFADNHQSPAISATLFVSPLYALVPGARDPEVDRVNVVRIVEAVILLIPSAGAAFDDPNAGPRRGLAPTSLLARTSGPTRDLIFVHQPEDLCWPDTVSFTDLDGR